MTLTWLVSSAFAADCDPAAAVAALESAALDGRSEDAQKLQIAAEAAFACSAAADPAVVARMFLAEAVVAQLAGEAADVDDALVGAVNASASTWNADLGPALQARHQKVAAATRPTGSLVLEPVPTGWVAAVDGKIGPIPAVASEGLHLAQVGPASGPMQFAKVVMVIPNETTRVQTGLSLVPVAAPLVAPAPLPAPVAAPVPVATARKKPTPLLIVGSVAALGAAGAAGGALAQNGAMQNAETTSDLDAAFGLQKGLAATTYTLLGLSAASLGVWVAW